MDYFERDWAYFRRRAASGPVDEVWCPNAGWMPYRGDRLKPVWYGNQISVRGLLAELEAEGLIRVAPGQSI